MTPDSTSPVPAVARRADPADDQQDPTVRVGHDRRGSLQEHHRPSLLRHGADIGDPVVAGRVADQAGVLAFVGGENGGGASVLEHRGGVVRGARARRPSASTTAGTGAAASNRPTGDPDPPDPPTLPTLERRARPQPGTDHQRSHPIQPRRHHILVPVVGGQAIGDLFARRQPPAGRGPGTPTRTYPAPARRAPRATSQGAPYMSGDPATTCTALCHLWAWRRRARPVPITSASVHQPC